MIFTSMESCLGQACDLAAKRYYAASSLVLRDGALAQLVEHRAFNPLVIGSNPIRPTIFL